MHHLSKKCGAVMEEYIKNQALHYLGLFIIYKMHFDSFKDIEIKGSKFRVYENNPSNTNVHYIFHHGAGHSSHTWALMAKEMRVRNDISLMCFDTRLHGESTRTGDLSLSQLSIDLIDIITTMYGANPSFDLILVGHSMGGSIMTKTANKLISLGIKILGLIVIDVVEGTATEALPFMKEIILKRPSSFPTIDVAINWSLRNSSGNKKSLEVSVPFLLERKNDAYFWKTDLLVSEPFWKEWFENMSEAFLSTKAAKLLIIAGTDRLDKLLTIGQIQGKYQLEILKCGHLIQEDLPNDVADLCVKFYDRNKRLILPPKVQLKK